MSFTKQELISKYRGQYPELENMPDDKLISNIVNKYPQIKSQISDYNLEAEKNMWDSMPNWIKSGYNKSIQGMATELSTGNKRFDLKNYHPGVLEDLGSEMISFFAPADFVVTALGGGIGGALAKRTATKYVAKKLTQNRVSKSVADKVAREAMRKQGRESVKSAGKLATSGLGLGTYSGVHSAFGQLTDPEQGYIDPGKTVKDFATGAVLGTAVNFTNSKLTKAGAGVMKKLAAEIGVAGTIQRPLTEGELPQPMDYITAGAMITGLKGAGYVGTKGIDVASKKLKKASQNINKKIKAEYEKEVIKNEASSEGIVQAYQAEIKTQLSAEKNTRKWISNNKRFSGVEFTVLPKEAQNIPGRVKVVSPTKGQTSYPQKWFASNFFLKDQIGMTAKQRLADRQGSIRSLEKELFRTSDKIGKQRLEAVSGIAGQKFNTDIKLKDLGSGGLTKYHDYLSDLKYIKTKTADMKKNGIEMHQLERSIFFDTLLPTKIKPLFEWMRAAKNRGSADPARRRFISVVNDFERTKAKTTVNALTIMDNLGLTLSKPNKQMIDKMVDATGRDRKYVVKNYNELYYDEVTKGNPLYAPQVKVLTDYLFNTSLQSGVPVVGYELNFLPKILKPEIRNAMFGDFAKLAQSLQKDKNKAYTKENLVEDLVDSFADFKKYKKDNPERVKILEKYIDANYSKLNKTTKQAFRELQQKNPELSRAEVMSLLGREAYRESASISGHLEKSRAEFGFPKEFYERNVKDVLSQYVANVARRSAEVKHFGKDREVLETLINDSMKRGNFVDSNIMKEISILTSSRLRTDPYRDLPLGVGKALNAILDFETITKIGGGYATLLNLSQPAISNLISLGLSNTARGLNSMRDPKVRRLVNQSEGNIYRYINELTGYADKSTFHQRWVQKALDVSKFNTVNDFNNRLAAATARVAVENFHKKYHRTKPGLRKTQFKQGMFKLGLTSEEVSKKTLSEESVLKVMGQFAKDSQLQKNILSDPLFLNNPYVRPFVQFRTFAIRQVPFISNAIKKDIQVGSVMPILRLVGTGVIGGYSAQKAKDYIRLRLSGEDPLTAPDSLMVRDLNDFADRLGALGAFGYVSDLWAAALSEERSVLGALTFMGLPAFASDIDLFFTRFLPSIESDIEKFGAAGLRRLPQRILDLSGAAVLKDIGKRTLETEGMKLDRLKALRNRKVSVFVNRLEKASTQEEYDNLSKDIKEWNKTYPRWFISGKDVNFKKIIQRKIRKYKSKL